MKMKIEALLLILAALQDHSAADEEQVFPLDMALNSVDDQYDRCSKEVAEMVRNTYLDRELRNNSDFKKVWEIAQRNMHNNTTPVELEKEHKIAIYAYTYPGDKNKNISNIFSKFNEDTRNGRENYTNKTYNWYSLHFLLTDTIHILKKTLKKCYKTFRGTNVVFKGQVSRNIRFGSFTSSSTIKEVAKKFGNESCFEILTCEGARIAKYSKIHDEEEVLIPPYEVFKIAEIKTNDPGCNKTFVLKCFGTMSDLNCSLIGTPLENTMM